MSPIQQTKLGLSGPPVDPLTKAVALAPRVGLSGFEIDELVELFLPLPEELEGRAGTSDAIEPRQRQVEGILLIVDPVGSKVTEAHAATIDELRHRLRPYGRHDTSSRAGIVTA